MCYIGINSEIEEKRFDQSNPAFCIEKMDFSDFNEKTFSSKNIYYIGSSEGCGCGFGIKEIPENIISEVRTIVKEKGKIPDKYREYFEYEDTSEQVEATIKENKEYVGDTKKNYSLICNLSEKNDFVEFFGCWAGSEKSEPDKIINIELKSDKLEIDFSSIWDLNIKMIIKK